MLTGVYETLRSAGRELVLELGERRALAGAHRRVSRRGRAASRTTTRRRRLRVRQPPGARRSRHGRAPTASSTSAISGCAASAPPATRRRAGASSRQRSTSSPRPTATCCRSCSTPSRPPTRKAKDRESALDFEDLQLRARDLLRDDAAIREREQLRFRSHHGRRVPGHEPPAVRAHRSARAGRRRELSSSATSSSRSTASATPDVQVFRERPRQAGDGVLPLTMNYRSRPEVLAVVNHLFGADFGDEFQPLAASGELPRSGLRGPPSSCSSPRSRPIREPTCTGGAARRVRSPSHPRPHRPPATRLPPRSSSLRRGNGRRAVRGGMRALSVPTYRSTGRGYFGQQQVVDLLAYLRSPQQVRRRGARERARIAARRHLERRLVLLRRAAPKRPLFVALERDLPDTFPQRDDSSCGHSSSASTA